MPSGTEKEKLFQISYSQNHVIYYLKVRHKAYGFLILRLQYHLQPCQNFPPTCNVYFLSGEAILYTGTPDNFFPYLTVISTKFCKLINTNVPLELPHKIKVPCQ